MPIVPPAIQLRLTDPQLDLIRPGLQLIVCGYAAKRQGHSSPFQYPSFLTPPSDPKTLGSFNQTMMDYIFLGVAENVSPEH
jgi:hypothetical protein